MRPSNHSIRTPATAICCTTVGLLAFLAIIRGIVLDVVPLRESARHALTTMLVGTLYDFLFVAAVALASLVLLWWGRERAAARRMVVVSYVLVATFILIVALINIENVKQLGGPFTYQWLYYSDFLASKEARDAITANVDRRSVIMVTVVPLALYASASLLFLVSTRLLRDVVTVRSVRFAGVALACGYVLAASDRIGEAGWPHTKVANPVVAFAVSYFWETPAIFTMDTPIGADRFEVVSNNPGTRRSLAPRTVPPIVNVVLYVLESVPARYLGAYGAEHGATPVLDGRRESSLTFTNVYAHAPNSPKALVALLLSLNGRIGYADVTSEHPDIAVPALSTVLNSRGHRTAMFYGSDLRYANQDGFLSGRDFDAIQDHRSRNCGVPTFVDTLKEEEYLDGSADHCTANAFRSWLEAAPSAPFFAVMWTMQTHYPYFVAGEERDFGVESPKLNRYLNALHESDRALGEVLETLEEKRLTDSTVVVVVGDHGESFGSHGQWGHGSSVYEENVHVPLVFINPRVFGGESNTTIGNLVDVAPTITDLLGLPVVTRWQGRSLFEAHPDRRAYFFSTWTNLIFGYRHGDRKYILNATENRYEIYDLKADPGETANLAKDSAAETLEVQHELAAWVQYQDRLLDRLTRPGDGKF